MNTTLFPRWLLSLPLGLGVFAALSAGVFAQDRERGEGRRRSRDPSEFLQRFDANKNGLLEPSEVPQFGRDFISRAAQHAGLDQSQAMPLDKLAEGMRASRESRDEDRGDRRDGDRREERRDEGRGSSSNGSSAPSSSAKPSSSPAVPGFGTQEKEAAKAPGFKVPLESPGGKLDDRYDRRIIERVDRDVLPQYDRNKDGAISYDEAKGGQWDPPIETSDLDKDGRVTRFELFERYVKKMGLPSKSSVVYTTSTGAVKPAEKSSASSDAAKVAEYAKGLLNRYDQNKNGMLERDEWKEMKADHQAADANKDGVITVEELTAKLANFASSNSSSSSSSSGGSSAQSSGSSSGGSSSGGRSWSGRRSRGDEKTASSNPSERKTYRFLSPTERLPKGLPDWFARNDADGDGQVMMAEYSTSFTDAVVAEFLKYDTNGDGVITPDECLEVTEREKTPKK